MSKPLLIIVALMAGMLAMPAQAAERDLRHFMFVGQPNATAWKFMMENPADRKAEVEGAFKALGGEVLSYYWGLGDGRNYITVTIPDDNELVQAVYLMRLPSGMLDSYEAIELMPSDKMSDALKRSKKLLEKDTTVK